jgi:inosose dehydratase
MLIGNAPCSWGITRSTGNKVGWRQYLEEVAAAGYRSTELGPFGYFPKDASAVRDELARRGLTIAGAAHVHEFGDATKTPELLATVRELGALLKALGAKHLVIMDESEWYPAGQEGVLDANGWRGLVAAVDAAQRVIEDELGLKASFHPHIGTAVEREAQIDGLLADTDIDLCFDTGHHAFWGQDPLTYLSRTAGRVAYIHLKNVDPKVRQRVLDGTLSIADSYGAGVMCPLPDGAVNIPAIMEFLDGIDFSGPVIVEQDLAENSPETPMATARRNLRYLGVIT